LAARCSRRDEPWATSSAGLVGGIAGRRHDSPGSASRSHCWSTLAFERAQLESRRLSILLQALGAAFRLAVVRATAFLPRRLRIRSLLAHRAAHRPLYRRRSRAWTMSTCRSRLPSLSSSTATSNAPPAARRNRLCASSSATWRRPLRLASPTLSDCILRAQPRCRSGEAAADQGAFWGVTIIPLDHQDRLGPSDLSAMQSISSRRRHVMASCGTTPARLRCRRHHSADLQRVSLQPTFSSTAAATTAPMTFDTRKEAGATARASRTVAACVIGLCANVLP